MSLPTEKRDEMLWDQYPRTTWFVGVGIFAALNLLIAISLEVIFGEGAAEPYAGMFAGMGVMLGVGMVFAAPLALAHWAFNDN